VVVVVFSSPSALVSDCARFLIESRLTALLDVLAFFFF
jgi:hypothetical protein